MSNADVADAKQTQVFELLSTKGETLATSRGKLVDDMFVSATTYLESYARRTGDDRPWRTWIGYQEAWRKHVADSISFVGQMNNVYSAYETLLNQAKNVTTREEMENAIVLLNSILQAMSPVIPPDFAQRFLNTARDVSYFELSFNFPELNRHCVFIHDSLRQFAEVWSMLHSGSVQFYETTRSAAEPTPTLVLFRLRIELAMKNIAPLVEGMGRLVADLNLGG